MFRTSTGLCNETAGQATIKQWRWLLPYEGGVEWTQERRVVDHPNKRC
jgi:hypothetical protein